MTLPVSGPLSLSAIYAEINGSHTSETASLGAMSDEAGFTEPDAVSDFYGYTHASGPVFVAAMGASGDIRYTEDPNGITGWTSIPLSTTSLRTLTLTDAGTLITGGSGDIIHRSVDKGLTWTNAQSTTGAIYGSAHSASKIIVVGGDSSPMMWVSTDDGVTWTNKSADVPPVSGRLYDAKFKDGYWFISSGPSYLYRSTDLVNWTNISASSRTCRKVGVSADNSTIVTVPDSSSTRYSPDFGNNWSTGSGASIGNVTAIISKGSSIWMTGLGASGFISKSVNDGANWTNVSAGLAENVFGMYYDSTLNRWFACCTSTSTNLRYSDDDGATWSDSTSFGTGYFANMVRV